MGLRVAQDVLGLGPKPADELSGATRIIADEGRGIVCLFREPRKRVFAEEEDGPKTIKQVGLGSQILSTLGVHDMILLTDSPETTYVAFDAAVKIAIVVAPYYKDIADNLIAGAMAEIEAAGGTYEIVEVPGALEVPTA